MSGMMETFGGLDTPLAHDLEEVVTPIGIPCWHCEEPIAEGDMGYIQSCLIRRDPVTNKTIHTREPIHWECMFRGIVGSVGHQRRECSCHGRVDTSEDGLTRHQAALAAVHEHESGSS